MTDLGRKDRYTAIRARRLARADARYEALVRERVALLRRRGAEPEEIAVRAGVPIEKVRAIEAELG